MYTTAVHVHHLLAVDSAAEVCRWCKRMLWCCCHSGRSIQQCSNPLNRCRLSRMLSDRQLCTVSDAQRTVALPLKHVVLGAADPATPDTCTTTLKNHNCAWFCKHVKLQRTITTQRPPRAVGAASRLYSRLCMGRLFSRPTASATQGELHT